ncbi:acyltransferase [Sphingobium aquiterrae]|uniref:acyltransferase family protein n=1 Tax=Sphingobium aquiterrae TaxID=2038656 RepID=UPI003017DF31
MDAGRQRKLVGIEALRGVAAVAVVLYHVARHLDLAYGAPRLMRLFQPGHAGVDLFFVLSGFIILHVHSADIGRPERLGHYARQRFLRLMPIYWIALLLTALALAAGGNGAPSAGWLLWSATLLPTWGEPLLGIAWTLQHELLFYLLFAVLILSRRWGMALLALWIGWVGFGLAGIAVGAIPPRLSSIYNLEFLFGMGAAALLASGRIAAPRLMAGVGAVLLLASGTGESLGLLDGYGDAARLTNGIPAALLIGGLAAWERQRGLWVPAVLRVLGAASYSIYLFQFLGLAVAWQIWGWLAPPSGLDGAGVVLPCFLMLGAVGVLGGVVMHRLVERPLLQWLRQRVAPRNRPAMGIAASR